LSSNRIDNLITEFNQLSASVKNQLTDLLVIISDGKVPSAEKMKAFDSDMSNLSHQYEEICENAKMILDTDELPEEGSSISNYAEAIKNSYVKKINQEVEEARETLTEFTHVRSRIADLAAEIKKYQSDALEMLNKLSKDTVAEIKPKSEPARVFMSVMKMSDEELFSEKGLTLEHRLLELFGYKVQLGIARKQYYLEGAGTPAAISGIESSRSIDMPQNKVEKGTNLEIKENKIESNSNQEKMPDTAKEDDEDISVNAKTEVDSDYLYVENKVRTSQPSASSFKKDIIKQAKFNPLIKDIIPMLSNLGALTAEQLYLLGVCVNACVESDKSRNDIYTSIEVLVAKGYLAKVKVNDNDKKVSVYYLASYTDKCIQKESIRFKMRGFWNMFFGYNRFVADEKISARKINEIVCNNDALLKYLYAMKVLMPDEEYNKIQESISWSEDHYNVLVIYDDDEYDSILVSEYNNQVEYKEKNILVCYSDYDVEQFTECKNIFVLDSGSITKCNDAINVDITEKEDQLKEQSISSAADVDDGEHQLHIGEDADDAEKADIAEESCKDKSLTEQNESNADLFESEIDLSRMVEASTTPSDHAFCNATNYILNRAVTTKEQLCTVITQAVLFAKGAGLEQERPNTSRISKQLMAATHLLIDDETYSSENFAEIFPGQDREDKVLMLSAYLFAMLTPAHSYDYGLTNGIGAVFENFDTCFPGLGMFKPLFNKMMGIKNVSVKGFTESVVSLLGNDAEGQKFLTEIKNQAKESLIVPTPKTRIRGLPKLYSKCFGKGSELYDCMEIIADGELEDENLELIESILPKFCDKQENSFSVNEEKIEQNLNTAWDEINNKNKFQLQYDAKDQAVKQFRNRISIMLSWDEHVNNKNHNKESISRLRDIKNDIISEISKLERNSEWKSVNNANILLWMTHYMELYLNGHDSTLEIFSGLLMTGIFSQEDNGTPIIDATMNDIKYYEPWRNALRYVLSNKKSIEEVKAEILGDDLDDSLDNRKDNLHQLKLLGKLLDSAENDYQITRDQIKEATASAEDECRHFKEKLELAYTYNRITETEKENLADIMTQYKDIFFNRGDFACWRDFLHALELQISTFTDEKKKKLRKGLSERLKKTPESEILHEANNLLEENNNFAVAEEYINRFDMGETQFDETFNVESNDDDYFEDFLSENVFNKIYDFCMRNYKRPQPKSLRKFGLEFLEQNWPNTWTSRLKDSSKDMVKNWPTRKGQVNPTQVEGLFNGLGFQTEKAAKINDRTEEMYRVYVTPTPKSKADYPHPIAAFGTRVKSPIIAVFLYGKYTNRQLVDTMSNLDLRGISIVFIDRPIDAASRRSIGEIFHTQTSGQNPFLLIDQVLFLYLALHQETERMPAMLKCTLPYTTYQPFVRDGGSTADEMFCGRTRELNTIMDPDGACVLYGGRQLGKTALLERAESRCSKPQNKEYAVYSTIARLSSEKSVVKKLATDIEKKTNGEICLNTTDTIKDLCDQLGDLFRRKEINTMHLFIDEVDDFLAAISDVAYLPIQPLVELRRETGNNFKFVIAGLHNVCRAQNATKENGVFGQLGTPLCIKPLSPSEALTLISRPLRYLGFRIDKYPHLATILANTNYYPGILQFFGYILVETLTGQYSKYYKATNGNPPFTLQDEQLGAVMNSSDLNKSIKEKFRLSLELDQRYFMIARCITMLYHCYGNDSTSGSWHGYEVDEIIGMAREYDIHCLENEGRNEYINLLDEMVDMGILSRPSTNHYKLRRSSFVDIIGDDMDILDQEIRDSNK
jgi:hypothetical protein